MDLHGDFAGSEFRSYLFIKHARNHQDHNFALACGECFVAPSQSSKLALLLAYLLHYIAAADDKASPPAATELGYALSGLLFVGLAADAVGSLIGKHKMIPRISPGKTWEGFAGAIDVILKHNEAK